MKGRPRERRLKYEEKRGELEGVVAAGVGVEVAMRWSV